MNGKYFTRRLCAHGAKSLDYEKGMVINMTTLIELNWTVIWTFVNIIVLFAFFRVFLFRPVTNMMEKRKQLIIHDLENAKETKEKAEKLKTDYEMDLLKADEEAAEIIHKANERAALMYDKQMNIAKEDANKLIQNANKQIELERKKSMEDAQSEIADIAILAAAKILGEQMDEKSNKRMVDDFIKEAGAVK